MIAAIHHPDGTTDFVRMEELKGWVLLAAAGRSGLMTLRIGRVLSFWLGGSWCRD